MSRLEGQKSYKEAASLPKKPDQLLKFDTKNVLTLPLLRTAAFSTFYLGSLNSNISAATQAVNFKNTESVPALAMSSFYRHQKLPKENPTATGKTTGQELKRNENPPLLTKIESALKIDSRLEDARRLYKLHSGTISTSLSILGTLIGTIVTSLGIYIGIRNYRKNPQTVNTESLFLQHNQQAIFLNGGLKKTHEIFGDRVEQRVINSAFRKAAEQFPILFVNPARYPEVVANFRSDLVSMGAERTVAALGLPPHTCTTLHSWHLVVVLRKSYLGKSPIIKRDFFTFTNMVEMLERPLEVFKSLEGINRRHFVYHLREAALVANQSPSVLENAIREAYASKINQLSDNTAKNLFVNEIAIRLSEQSKSLLRLLVISTEKALELLEKAVSSGSLNEISEAVALKVVEKSIEDRRRNRSLYERWIDPVIHFIWKDSKIRKVWLAARTPPNEFGLYEFFAVGEMNSIERKA